jgi:hypothetical protein
MFKRISLIALFLFVVSIIINIALSVISSIVTVALWVLAAAVIGYGIYVGGKAIAARFKKAFNRN